MDGWQVIETRFALATCYIPRGSISNGTKGGYHLSMSDHWVLDVGDQFDG